MMIHLKSNLKFMHQNIFIYYFMESLTFPTLFLMLQRSQPNLQTLGFSMQYEPNENIFKDKIIILHHVFMKTYYFSITHQEWKRCFQFDLSSNNTGRYYFQLNPLNGLPVRVYPKKLGAFWQTQDIQHDVHQFGEQVLQLIHQFCYQLNNDTMAITINQTAHGEEEAMNIC